MDSHAIIFGIRVIHPRRCRLYMGLGEHAIPHSLILGSYGAAKRLATV